MAAIVILGSGFGGIAALMELSKTNKNDEIIVVSKNNNFEFIPLIPEIAVNNLKKEDISVNTQSLSPNCTLINCEATSINFSRKVVVAGNKEIKFDYLLIAAGSVPNINNLPKQINPDDLLTLKTIENAELIRKKLIEVASNYSLEIEAAKKSKMKILIIGAGATGIEIAGEITRFLKRFFKKRRKNEAYRDVAIYICNRDPDIIPDQNEKFRNYVKKRLAKLGINVICESNILSLENNIAVIGHSNGKQKINVSLILLATGVRPAPIKTIPMKTNENGSFEVNEYLEVKGAENVWAVGDIALCINPLDKKPVPMLAQSAYDMGFFAGKNIAAKIKGKKQRVYVFRSKGFLLSIGKYAVGNIFGLVMAGWLVWWIKRTAYALEFPGIKNKVKAFWRISFLSVFK